MATKCLRWRLKNGLWSPFRLGLVLSRALLLAVVADELPPLVLASVVAEVGPRPVPAPAVPAAAPPLR